MVDAGRVGLRWSTGPTDAAPPGIRGAGPPDLDPDPDPLVRRYCDPVVWHIALHPGVPSHCSPNCISTTPSPQYGAGVHAVVQIPIP